MSVEQPHVCLLACSHVPDDVRVTHKVGRSMREAGFQVTWVGPNRPRTGDDYGIDFRYYPLGKGRIGRLLHFRKLYAMASQIEGVDVWYGVEPDSGNMACKLARTRGGKSVFSIHEMYHDEMLGRWAKGRRRTLISKCVRHSITKTCNQVDLTVGVGLTRIEPYQNTRSEKMIVRNCSPKSFAKGSPASVLSSDRDSITIMHGKTDLARGTAEAIEAVDLCLDKLPKKPKLLMFSQGTATALAGLEEDELRELAAGNADYLELRKIVPYKAMFDILRGCDIGLILYNRDWGVRCMPNRMFEYMAMGIPVIAPEYAVELKRIIEPEGCGLLVDAENTTAIAEAILYLAEHPDVAREMGRRGRQAFEARHNWESEFLPLEQWIRNAAKSRTTGTTR